jgi:hypothetical protein
MSAGYSSTPLAKKLEVKPGSRLVVLHASADWTIDDLPEGVTLSRRKSAVPTEVVVAFFSKLATMQDELVDLSRLITVDGSLWLAWPRRAGGHHSDITDNHVRAAALPLGLVDVKVAALDDDWSGLKLVWRKERRAQRATTTN